MQLSENSLKISCMNASRIIVEMLVQNNWQNDWIRQIDSEKLINLAIDNKVLSNLSHWIFENNIDHHFKSTNTYPLLVESLLLNERDIRSYKKVLNLLNCEFAKSRIDICLLKGLSLRGKSPRDMGDLDILIHEGDLEKVIVKKSSSRDRCSRASGPTQSIFPIQRSFQFIKDTIE